MKVKDLVIREFSETIIMQCEYCDGDGEILQADGSDSTGTLITCEYCDGSDQHVAGYI